MAVTESEEGIGELFNGYRVLVILDENSFLDLIGEKE